MAATILSGTGNVTYTNSTGQNVRIVINFLRGNGSISFSWGPSTSLVTVTSGVNTLTTIGRNLSVYSLSPVGGQGLVSTNMQITNPLSPYAASLPTEIMIKSGEIFSASCSGAGSMIAYNIVVIPEAG